MHLLPDKEVSQSIQIILVQKNKFIKLQYIFFGSSAAMDNKNSTNSKQNTRFNQYQTLTDVGKDVSEDESESEDLEMSHDSNEENCMDASEESENKIEVRVVEPTPEINCLVLS